MPNRGPFIDVDLLPSVAGLEVPSVGPREYVLVDDDERVCRVISEKELDASYVDHHIDTFKLDQVDWLTLNVDQEMVKIKYTTGAKTELLLGAISLGPGKVPEEYYKTKGVIYPLDPGRPGDLLLNASTTPALVAMRTWYLNEARRAIEERIKIAEVVHIFAGTVGALGNARGELP
jgi:hypothetical protein